MKFQVSDLVESTLSISELSSLHKKLSERLYTHKVRRGLGLKQLTLQVHEIYGAQDVISLMVFYMG